MDDPYDFRTLGFGSRNFPNLLFSQTSKPKEDLVIRYVSTGSNGPDFLRVPGTSQMYMPPLTNYLLRYYTFSRQIFCHISFVTDGFDDLQDSNTLRFQQLLHIQSPVPLEYEIPRHVSLEIGWSRST
jgi:hypothetical protein